MPNSSHTQSPFRFAGFESPRSTQVPDAFFDEVAPQLTEGELRVALYIIRRTFGFKKDTDNISLRQMVEGITTREGRVLDRGTGLKKSAVANALNGLERKGVIVSRRNRSAERGNEPTTYSLNMKDSPLSIQADKGLSVSVDNGLSIQADTQQTVLQHTGTTSKRFDGSALSSAAAHAHARSGRPGDQSLAQPDNSVAAHQTRPRERGFAPVGHILGYRQDTAPTDGLQRPETARETADDPASRPTSRPGPMKAKSGARRDRPQAPPAIEHYISQFSSEFRDAEHIPQNISQAASLCALSGKSPDHFLQLMFEARAITRSRATVRSRANRGAESGPRKKMPYFFSVLKGLLGLKAQAVTHRVEEPARVTDVLEYTG